MADRRLHTGFSVSHNRWLMQRYAYLEERLMTLLAGWIWTTPVLEDKIELMRCSYESSLATAALHLRAAELFPPTAEPERPVDMAALDAWCNEVANADDLVERLVGVFRVAKPQLLTAYRRHLAATDDLIDGPTATILRPRLPEIEAQLAWGERRLTALLADPVARDRAVAWQQHLETAWAQCGGLQTAAAGQPVYRQAGPPARYLTSFPARDDRFRIVPVDEYNVPSMGTDANEILRHLLYQNTYGEMEAADMLGRILADAPDLPWAMRLDLARQMWDEARHAEMSWRRMLELGGPPEPRQPLTPLILTPSLGLTDPFERLLVLQRVIEGRVTERHRYRVHYLAQELGDPVTARLFEYIVADERAHVGYAEWIPRLIGDDPARLARLDQVHATAESLFESLLTRRLDRTAGMREPRRSA